MLVSSQSCVQCSGGGGSLADKQTPVWFTGATDLQRLCNPPNIRPCNLMVEDHVTWQLLPLNTPPCPSVWFVFFFLFVFLMPDFFFSVTPLSLLRILEWHNWDHELLLLSFLKKNKMLCIAAEEASQTLIIRALHRASSLACLCRPHVFWRNYRKVRSCSGLQMCELYLISIGLLMQWNSILKKSFKKKKSSFFFF